MTGVIGSPASEARDGLKIRVRRFDSVPGHCANSDSMALAPGSRVAVRNYAGRNPWLEQRDLEQEAAVAALEAGQSWRQDGGTSRDLWEAWIVGLALSRFVAEQRCPVSLPKCKGESWDVASGAKRVATQVRTDSGIECEHPAVASFAAEQFEPIEDRLDHEHAAAEVRRILAAESEAARAVLLAEEKSAEVAKRMGLPVRQVYEDTARAVRALRAALCPLRTQQET
jgi:DNA-directed RNA polymerase specialized sigma24 family protein